MKVFISYSWDSEDHKSWVRMFARTLIENGVEVVMDQYDLPLGGDRFKFMEDSIRDVQCVLCVCTPEYVKRADSREKGVGEETKLITPKFFEAPRGKEFIPILRRMESHGKPTPDYMAALIYVDFRDDSAFPFRMEELLRHLHKQPKHAKPPLGKIPNFGMPDAFSKQTDTPSANELYQHLKSAFPYGQNDTDFLLNFGRLCYYLEKDNEAQQAFGRILELDSEYSSFPELDSRVTALAKAHKPFEMNPDSRKALAYLGIINKDEDYILNSAYDSGDPEVLVLAGKYYLIIFDADIPTAIAYFIKATKCERVNSVWVTECDNAIYRILSEKKFLYPKVSWDYIKECVKKWNEHKLGLL
jgi:hypothetical protein